MSSGLSERSQSPVSRTGTPNFLHPHNIAPQHMFEQALNVEIYHSPALGGFVHRAPSPSASSLNGSHLEPPLPYDTLNAQNTALKTRVSEMELINDLFRNRVSELEGSENAARETEAKLRAELDEVRMREAELKRRLDEFEDEGPRHKKPRLMDDISNLIDDSHAASPIAMAE
jgi:GATA-binding protein